MFIKYLFTFCVGVYLFFGINVNVLGDNNKCTSRASCPINAYGWQENCDDLSWWANGIIANVVPICYNITSAWVQNEANACLDSSAYGTINTKMIVVVKGQCQTCGSSGFCAKQCSLDSQCLTGNVCRNALKSGDTTKVCFPELESCTSNIYCGTTLPSCINSVCTKQCVSDGDCPSKRPLCAVSASGQSIKYCQPLISSCTGDWQCGTSKPYCLSNTCQASCTSDSQCPTDLPRCARASSGASTMQCQAGISSCSADWECGTSKPSCIGGVCMKTCVSDVDCPSTMPRCASTSLGGVKLCLLEIVSCGANWECGSNKPYCISGLCKASFPPSCNFDNECGSGDGTYCKIGMGYASGGSCIASFAPWSSPTCNKSSESSCGTQMSCDGQYCSATLSANSTKWNAVCSRNDDCKALSIANPANIESRVCVLLGGTSTGVCRHELGGNDICYENAACGTDKKCVSSRCYNICSTNSDCTDSTKPRCAALTSSGGQKVCQNALTNSCTGDWQCGSDKPYCIAGSCAAECMSDPECLISGYVCRKNGGGTCPDASITCYAGDTCGSECTSHASCTNGAKPYCVKGICSSSCPLMDKNLCQLSLNSCTSGVQCGSVENTCTGGICGKPCSSDMECITVPGGKTSCNAKIEGGVKVCSVPAVSCNADWQCGTVHSKCENNKCMQPCSADAECSSGKICALTSVTGSHKMCQNSSSSCTGNWQCGTSLPYCINGQCGTMPQTCRQDIDCGFGTPHMICNIPNGKLSGTCEISYIQSTTQITAGTFYQNANITPSSQGSCGTGAVYTVQNGVPGCTVISTSTNNNSGSGGSTATTSACTQDSHCGSNLICVLTSATSGVCRQSPSARDICEADAACGTNAGQVCWYESGSSGDKYCLSSIACSANNLCTHPTLSACINGACKKLPTTPCTTDEQCGINNVCATSGGTSRTCKTSISGTGCTKDSDCGISGICLTNGSCKGIGDLVISNMPSDSRVFEKNAIADSLCRAIDIATGEAGKAVFGIILLAIGLGVMQGKVTPSLFVGLTVGILMFFASDRLVGFLVFGNRAKGGCSCRSQVVIARTTLSDGTKIELTENTGLTQDPSISDKSRWCKSVN